MFKIINRCVSFGTIFILYMESIDLVAQIWLGRYMHVHSTCYIHKYIYTIDDYTP